MTTETTTLSPQPEVFTDTTCWCRDFRGNAYSFEQSLVLIRKFHGHLAPGLVIGTRMVTMAVAHLPPKILFDAVCETDSCLPDAVQMLTPCTIGNGWLRIRDLGRYAVTLYDKSEGSGVRVFIDSTGLHRWPVFHGWFYKTQSKTDQNFDQLINEIHRAGREVMGVSAVRIKPDYLGHRSKGRIATCPSCREAYPAAHGSPCRGCQGEAPCEPGAVALNAGQPR